MSEINASTPDVKRVLDFWFDRNPIDWVMSPAGLDDQIKTQFGDLVAQARRNELDAWATAGPEPCLALVALLDQFPRNLYRGTPEAYACDPKAFAITTRAIAHDFDKRVNVVQASSFYLTILNKEEEIAAIASRSLWTDLRPRCETEQEKKWVEMGISATQRHLVQLEQFGRYPTRNKSMGRENTEAEEKYLADMRK
ncbi:DUF924-domain-containing protein [Apiospora arundinis]|uniref:DUF924-domain-containing protein n=1 Tax=Apiospora arundinis TaxID=335852 RepID=A0ABR2JCP3_9PEZI